MKHPLARLTLVLSLALSNSLRSEESKFPCPENEIAHYTAFHVSEPITIDGKLDEAAWQQAPRHP